MILNEPSGFGKRVSFSDLNLGRMVPKFLGLARVVRIISVKTPRGGKRGGKSHQPKRIQKAESTEYWHYHLDRHHPFRWLGHLCHRPGWPPGGGPLVGERREENHGGGAQLHCAHCRKSHQGGCQGATPSIQRDRCLFKGIPECENDGNDELPYRSGLRQ